MSNEMVQHFVKQMQSEFEMSPVGELIYLLGLQVKQMEDSICLSQRKYAKNVVKKFGMEYASYKRTHVLYPKICPLILSRFPLIRLFELQIGLGFCSA